jgi:peptidoglycan/xylan/chitin deacetylase (PgdA/CDA1 family)
VTSVNVRGRGFAITLTALALACAQAACSSAGSAASDTPALATVAGKPTGCKSTIRSVVEHGSRARKRVALTFDDGPSKYTPRVLALLRRAGAKSTFFPVAKHPDDPGSGVLARKALLKKEFAAGMEIGNHTYTHADLGNGGPPATEEMEKETALIRSVIGFTPCVFRPPYRGVGNDLVPRVNRLGMTTVRGDVEASDWQIPGKQQILDNVLPHTRNGSIIIMHDGGGDRSQTLAVLPKILAEFKRRGYKLVTVSQLLGFKSTSG